MAATKRGPVAGPALRYSLLIGRCYEQAPERARHRRQSGIGRGAERDDFGRTRLDEAISARTASHVVTLASAASPRWIQRFVGPCCIHPTPRHSSTRSCGVRPSHLVPRRRALPHRLQATSTIASDHHNHRMQLLSRPCCPRPAPCHALAVRSTRVRPSALDVLSSGLRSGSRVVTSPRQPRW